MYTYRVKNTDSFIEYVFLWSAEIMKKKKRKNKSILLRLAILEKAARERLGYVYPDEQVFIDISGN